MVESSPKSGRSIDYPLTMIRLSIPGHGFECVNIQEPYYLAGLLLLAIIKVTTPGFCLHAEKHP